MRTHANKKQGNNAGSRIGSRRNSGSPFSDNRPEAIAQRKFQGIADTSSQAKQLKSLQDITHTSDKTGLKQTPSFHSNVIQGYFEGKDLAKGNVPDDARISENLKIVKEGKQDVYADPEKIKEANAALEADSRIVFKQGEQKEYDLESQPGKDGLSTISFTDFYQVIPRYNPNVPTEDDTPRSQSAEVNDTPEVTKNKHRDYVISLLNLQEDFRQFLAAITGKQGDGIRSWDGREWFGQASAWLKGNAVRDDVLRLGLMEIAAKFSVDNDRESRNAAVETLLGAYIQFMSAEMKAPDKIVLPTDCGQMVHYIVKFGKTKKNDSLDDNPALGSNYYTELPKNASNVGWNYHWGGVVLKDGGDNVTLESAGGTSLGSLGKQSWWFEMYGTKKVDQTFKKQVHQTHINRNRALVDQAGGNTKNLSHSQLDDHQEKINKWK
ncbi:MAG: hypothetical protein ACO1N0_10710 [Fluviicola sp.]